MSKPKRAAAEAAREQPERWNAHVTTETADKATPSTVSFNLEQQGKLVKLTLTHQDFADDDRLLDGISKGWPAIMSSLNSLLELGKPLDIPLAALGMEGVK